ncbi:MAG: hypothetical protein AAFV93_12580 [Chloroflexota bacterium]
MSILALPRFHFSGQWMVNPCTTNNDDVNLYNDYTNMNVINKPNGITTDAEFRAWMMQLKTGTGTPLDGQYVNAGWNYFGDGTIGFNDLDGNPAVNVTMGCLPDGQLIQNDPLLGARVRILGNKRGSKPSDAIMVDVDPASNYSVQIFASYFVIEIPDGSGGWIEVLTNTEPQFMSAYARYMSLSRNTTVHGDTGSSIIWQWAIPKDNLTINTDLDSQILSAFASQLADSSVQGIQIQFDCFLMTHKYGNPELVHQYFDNRIEEANPAYGPIVGSVGLWHVGESQNVPSGSGRVLYPIISVDPSNPDAPHLPSDPNTPIVGQAVAYVDTSRQVVVLNLTNTIPEVGAFSDENPFSTKYNFGTLNVSVGHATNGTYEVASLASLPYEDSSGTPYTQYNSTAYSQTGGIVELSYAGSDGAPYVENGQLQVIFNGRPILLEIANANMMSDQFGVYLNQGETVDITIRAEGAGNGIATDLSLEEYRCIVIQGEDEPCKSNALSMGGFATCQFTFLASDDYPNILSFPSSTTTDSDGNVTITVQALEPGISFLRFIPPAPTTGRADDQLVWELATLNQSDPNNPFNDYPTWQYDMYIAVRVLPLDEGLNDPNNPNYVSDDDLEGEDGFNNYIYPLVFRYYYLLYPGMSKRINFSKFNEMQENANIIKTFVRAQNRENTLYMPVTRELSDGKRRLIQRWAAINE